MTQAISHSHYIFFAEKKSWDHTFSMTSYTPPMLDGLTNPSTIVSHMI